MWLSDFRTLRSTPSSYNKSERSCPDRSWESVESKHALDKRIIFEETDLDPWRDMSFKQTMPRKMMNKMKRWPLLVKPAHLYSEGFPLSNTDFQSVLGNGRPWMCCDPNEGYNPEQTDSIDPWRNVLEDRVSHLFSVCAARKRSGLLGMLASSCECAESNQQLSFLFWLASDWCWNKYLAHISKFSRPGLCIGYGQDASRSNIRPFFVVCAIWDLRITTNVFSHRSRKKLRGMTSICCPSEANTDENYMETAHRKLSLARRSCWRNGTNSSLNKEGRSKCKEERKPHGPAESSLLN